MMDFNIIRTIGRGGYGKVMLVEKKDTKKLYAIKSLRKDKLLNGGGEIEKLFNERKILILVRPSLRTNSIYFKRRFFHHFFPPLT